MENIDRIIIAIFVVLIGLLFWFLRQSFSRIEKSNTNITSFIKKINNAIIEIQTIFTNKDIKLNYLLTEEKGSPLRPTMYGIELIKDSGLEKILDEHKELLVDNVKEKLPKDYSPYDVQEISRDVLVNFKGDHIMKPVKDYAFENALSIKSILLTGGLWLRDDVLGVPRRVPNDKS